MPTPSLCLQRCSYWLSSDFISRRSTTEEACDQPFLSGNIHRRLHFHPTKVLAGCLSLQLIVCTWWYLYWQVGGKGEIGRESLCEGHLLWTCSISSVGFHLLKNQMEPFALPLFGKQLKGDFCLSVASFSHVLSSKSNHDYMQTTSDNWRLSPWGLIPTASLCHPRAWGCSVGSRFLLLTSLVSGLMWQQFYMRLQNKQLSYDPCTSFLYSSSSNWGSSSVLPGAAQIQNKRWSLPAKPTFSSEEMIAGCVLWVKGQRSHLHMSWQGQSSCETEHWVFSTTWLPQTLTFKPPLPRDLPSFGIRQSVFCSLRDDGSFLALFLSAERQIFLDPCLCPC